MDDVPVRCADCPAGLSSGPTALAARPGPAVGATSMPRRAFAVLVAVHGLIHLIGFVVPWRLAPVDGFPYRTTAFNGSLLLGETGAQVIGVAWLALAVGFVIAGLGIWRSSTWALPLTAALAMASLIVCVLGLPEAAAGIVVNVAILGVVASAAFVRPGPVGTSR